MKLKQRKYLWEYLLFTVAILLFVSSFLLSYIVQSKYDLRNQAVLFTQKVSSDYKAFDSFTKDTHLIKKLTAQKFDAADVSQLQKIPFYFYIYTSSTDTTSLKFWNNNVVLPTNDILKGPDGESFMKLANGYYYVIKKTISDRIACYALVLIKSSFFVETKDIVNTFPYNKKLIEYADLSYEPNNYMVKANSGKALFYLNYKPNVSVSSDSEVTIFLRIFGLFLIFLSIYFLLNKRFRAWNRPASILFFLCCMAAFRLLISFFRIEFNLNSFVLFDPLLYGSSTFLPTLGDLFISTVIYSWAVITLWSLVNNNKIRTIKATGLYRWVYGVIGIVLLILNTYVSVYIIRSLILDSKISFDITNYESLNIYTFVGFVILAGLALSYYYFNKILFKNLFRIFSNRLIIIIGILAIIGLLLISIFLSHQHIKIAIICLAWLLVYVAINYWEDSYEQIKYYNISTSIFWLLFFSLSIALLTSKEIATAEINSRKQLAERLYSHSDPANAKLIRSIFTPVNSTFLGRNFYKFYNERDNKYLRDSLFAEFENSNIKNYDLNIYIFDSLNQPLYNNQDDIGYDELQNLIARQGRPTAYADMQYFETVFDRFGYFIQKNAIAKTENFKGSVILLFYPQKYTDTNIKQGLFKYGDNLNLNENSVYHYAIYDNRVLKTSSRRYPFATVLLPSEVPFTKFEIRSNDNYSELWYRPHILKTIVLSRRNQGFVEFITLFSYLFSTFLLLLFTIQVISFLINALLKGDMSRFRFEFLTSIKSQIHLTFIFISIISFLLVGAGTVAFFRLRFVEMNNEKLSSTINVIVNELKDSTDINTNVGRDLARKIINNLSAAHSVAINVYDMQGRIAVSSQNEIFNRGFISTQMNPIAYEQLGVMKKIEWSQKESVGNLDYMSIYAPLRSSAGYTKAIIGIPFFESKNYNKPITDFLATLINVYAFIYLIAGLITLMITTRITRAFSFLSQRMREINFTDRTDLLQWNRKDEIGMLVTEYNRMVEKLRLSAANLAKAQKEEAWREMARQVAHEIKNPLTPMKLSLQFLQNAIHEKRDNVSLLAANVSNTLLEQIDHLSNIASDFSQFAKLSSVRLVKFDLHEVIDPLIDLYKQDTAITINWDKRPEKIFVTSDKTQMNSLFTNLITNAIEALTEVQNPAIIIKESIIDNSVIITVQDNGYGIEDHVKSEIFTPYFTTKNSGTGLGLAMCKSIVENSNGKIWFESSKERGTIFYVSLPM